MVDTAGGAFNILALRKKDNTDWIEHLQKQNRQFRERLYQWRPQTLKDMIDPRKIDLSFLKDNLWFY